VFANYIAFIQISFKATVKFLKVFAKKKKEEEEEKERKFCVKGKPIGC
jgi:hypothetical protein